MELGGWFGSGSLRDVADYNFPNPKIYSREDGDGWIRAGFPRNGDFLFGDKFFGFLGRRVAGGKNFSSKFTFWLRCLPTDFKVSQPSKMKHFKLKDRNEVSFEESVSDDWVKEADVFEKPIDIKFPFYVGIFAVLIFVLALGRILFLASNSEFYKARASANLSHIQRIPAPRGVISDYQGKVLADNKPIFLALLDVNEFLRKPDFQGATLKAADEILGVVAGDFWEMVEENGRGALNEVLVLNNDLDQNQLVKLETLNLPTIQVSNGFARTYPDGKIFAPIIGYTGVVSEGDLKDFPELGGGDFVGKTGLEVFYEDFLRGKPGVLVKIRDAKGNVIEEKEEVEPEIGQELTLTVNAGLQKYFYNRLQGGLNDLGRTVGLGLAIDPRDGRVLAMVNIPSYDNNVFTSSARREEVMELLTSSARPLFNRVVGGLYAPGSTIKPLHAVAALEEKVIEPEREIFSPGYLDIANPYNPDSPSRFLDWQYQGWVNMYSALAQSSNVYFYTIGGGVPARSVGETVYEGPRIAGLGIKKLTDWWRRFGLGETLGIDLYGEKAGVLPSPESREEETGRAWLLGDTYNVSIGQGDLLVTPLQLLSYIGAVANGGKVYRPFLALELNEPKVVRDLVGAEDSILEVQEGMELAVKSSKGTARTMNDLPFYVAGKTGSAQVMNKTQENAFFVGYAGIEKEDPEIAILVLIENSRQGSLNAVPIAKDVLYWYYLNKMGKRDA